MTKKIQRIMRKHGLTQKSLARDLNVTETWLSLVLNRKGKSRRVLREIARRTGTRIEELFPSFMKDRTVSKNPSYAKDSEGEPFTRKAA